jgi:hypothetical protein
VRLCLTHGCKRPAIGVGNPVIGQYCGECGAGFSAKALQIMQEFALPLGVVLVAASEMFHTAQQIADYLDISLPTLYSWVRRYHGLSFRQFKRKFICTKRTCIVLDHGATDYSWKYTMADRVHQHQGCVCFIEGSDELMMTTLSPQTVSEVLRAEVPVDPETGVRHIRYPVHLPIFNPPSGGSK